MIDIELREFINPKYAEQFPARMQFQWATDIISKGRKSQRNQRWSQPKRHFYINWGFLLQAGRDKFIEIFNRAKGSYDTFKLLDNVKGGDYICELSECSITAIAAQVDFQLIKTYYAGETEEWDENKTRIVPGETFPPVIKIDGVTKTEDVDYTLDDDTGIVTFGAAPGEGKIITANYQFYFQVRFDFDTYIDERFIYDYWQANDIHLVEDE